MNYTPTICTGCAKGCNADVWVRDNLVMRFTPRKNLQVNTYWMCDEGRLDYKKYNENRTSGIYTKGNPLPWEEALQQIAQLLAQQSDRIVWVGSAFASVETLYVLKALRDKVSPEAPLYYVPHIQPGWGDHLLRRDDRTPNARGAEALGYTPISTQAFLEKLQAQPNALLYWVEDDLALGEILSQLPAETLLIAHTYNRSAHPERLTYEIAASTHLESFATFINEDGLAQTVQPARQWQQMKPTDWFYLPKSRLDAAGQAVDAGATPPTSQTASPPTKSSSLLRKNWANPSASRPNTSRFGSASKPSSPLCSLPPTPSSNAKKSSATTSSPSHQGLKAHRPTPAQAHPPVRLTAYFLPAYGRCPSKKS
jgi:NADH-quinone oxidoreductase subunit G